MIERDSKKVIRYTKEEMIRLHDSPLVTKPDSFPCLSTWFGEDLGSPILKNMLNGSSIPRTVQDKNILLGPPKTNFASSLYVKKNEVCSTKHSTRHKTQHLESTRLPRNNINHPNNSNNSNNNHSNNHSNHHNHNNQSNFGDKGYNNKTKYNTTTKRFNKRDHHQSNRMRSDDGHNERVPEWLDYSPEPKVEETNTNDLEIWKSSMKKKEEGAEKEAEEALSFLSIDQSNGFDDFFMTDGELPSRRDNQAGSRFAKFFAKREEEPMTTSSSSSTSEPRSISVNDLFGGRQALPQSVSQNTPQTTPQSAPQNSHQIVPQNAPHNTPQGMLQSMSQHMPQNAPPAVQQEKNNGRVLSEDDILKSLGAKKNQEKPMGNDAIGFNRVLQILSQPKPAIGSEEAEPASNETEKVSSKPSTPALSHRFGNTNLPTAVLRQMSARSSPSLQSTKTPPLRNPTAKPQPQQPQPQQQQQPVPPVPYFPYQQPPYSPHQQQMMDMFPVNQMMPPRPNGNNMDQFLAPHMIMQPPPMPPPGVPTQNNAQRPMMPPHHPLMQSQFPMQREMMPPMPPYVMANGMPPPQQLFNKTQGWERRQ
ncbi:hypothetical protein BY458DRAFT_455752 [Sporodiniella umbellata]|nr:hypothetical protein BY458DRAFT_455752 [Sporodiniella umbellata]